MAKERENVGASSSRTGEDRRRGLGWLWWLLLAAGIIALAVFLLLRNVGDEGDDPGVDVDDEASAGANEDEDVGEGLGDTEDEVTDGGDGTDGDGDGDDAAGTSTTEPSEDAGTATTQGGAAGGTGGGSATTQAGASGGPGGSPLTSEGAPLLPVPADGLATYAGQPAEARSVQVQSVVADEGFWVGDSEADRVFVFFAAENAGTESGVTVEAGRPVSFTGTVEPLPPDFESVFEVDPAEGADQLAEQGHYVEVAPDAIQQG